MIDVNLIGAPAFAVTVTEDDFIYTGVNRRMIELTGLRREDMIGRSPRACLPPEIADVLIARYRQCVAARQAIDSEAHYDLQGGGRWWHVTVTPVFDPDGTISSLVGVSTDVTDRKAAEQNRRETDARMALAMDVLDGGFWHFDIATGGLELTPKLAAMVAGRATDHMSWAEFTAAIHPGDHAAIDLAELVRGDREEGTVEYRVPDPAGGGTRWFRSRRRLVRDEDGAPNRIIGVVVEVTEQRQLQETYERQARTDPLTGLANRRGFEGGAERFFAAAGAGRGSFGLILLDLDQFKPINDRHGHATGDLVLRELAARLRRLVRPDDLVARLGGDEFAILVADVENGVLPYLAQRLVLAAQQPVSTPAGELSIGISIGVATSIEGDLDIAELAARADRALYDVKVSGRGAWKIAA